MEKHTIFVGDDLGEPEGDYIIGIRMSLSRTNDQSRLISFTNKAVW